MHQHLLSVPKRSSRAAFGATLALAMAVVCGTALPVQALERGAAAPLPASLGDKPELMISKFVFQFEPQHPNLPSIDELLAQTSVTLVRVNDGFAVEGPEEAKGQVTILQINEHLAENGKTKFSIEAVRSIFKAVGNALAARQLIGVFISTEGDEVLIEKEPETGAEKWIDQRDPDGELTLKGKILIPVVTGLRTVAAGDRLGPDETRVDNPRHERILKASPLQPRPSDPSAARQDLLLRDEIDDFVFRLNRHPGRRVDVALSNASETEVGAVVLDYLVRENQPWILYLQASNTGTKQTNEWRERVGFIHNQLLDNDDTLALDYVTGGFDTTNLFNGSYTMPLSADGRLRGKINGGYSEFDASEVGQSNENFNGNSWQAGGELSYNVFQWRELFLDVYAGGRFQHVEVVNNTLGVALRGDTDFALFGGGVRLDRATDAATTSVDLGFDVNAPGLAGTSSDELTRLGRLGTQKDFAIFHFSAEQSVFLEPIFDSENYKQGKSTLAHEIAVMIRGQLTSDRVAPSFQQVAGGLYTVRGYDESASAGDSVVIATFEYRLHIPRLLDPREPGTGIFGEEFRWAPQQPYGRPDWDLIFRAFVDAGRTVNSDRLSFERDEDLLGAGVGLELLFKRNINIRLDWGSVLNSVGTGRGLNEEGDNRFHFVATLLF